MNKQLNKNIGFIPAFSMVIGTVIGSGVFFKASIIYKTTGDISLGLLAWILAGVITICAGLTVAELGAAIPETGGMIVWIERVYGKTFGYLFGWAQVAVYMPASIAAQAVVFSTQVINLYGLDSRWLVPIGACTAASVMFLNFLGNKVSGTVQTLTTIFKLLPLIAIVVFSFFQSNPVTISVLPNSSTFSSDSFVSNFGIALLSAMFAYDGWLNIGNIAGEIKNPKKNLPRAIILGIAVLIVVYVLVNLAFLITLPLESIAGNSHAATDVATKLFGPLGGKIITIGILISVYGAANGFTMASIRLPYVLAEKKQIPFANVWTKLNRFGVPFNSGLLILVLTIAMMFTGSFDLLTDLLLFVLWTFSILTFIAVIILRKREPELVRPYKVPLYPVLPIIASLGGGYIVINTLLTQTVLSLSGLGLTLVGLLFYTDLHKKFKK